MISVSIQDLYDANAERLGLRWLAGQKGAQRSVTAQGVRETGPRVTGDDLDPALHPLTPPAGPVSASRALVGHLNLIHPNQVQVLGALELRYLSGLREISRQDAIRQLFSHAPVCLVLTEGRYCPEDITQICTHTQTPLFVTESTSDRVVDTLQYFLSNRLAQVVTLHGVFMEVTAMGVLLAGPPGVGKSELALELITRGHRLVADDAPEFSRIAPDIITGSCPPALSDFLEVRGIGIINVRHLFGDSAIKRNKYLRLIIRLERLDRDQLVDIDRLAGSYRTRRILEVDIPEITIPVAPGRNLAVLVECAARNHLLRASGYNSTEDFIQRQNDRLAPKGPPDAAAG
ncbi:MAG: HPr(Ser) kinase/phosphatase [Chromatiales bacterium]